MLLSTPTSFLPFSGCFTSMDHGQIYSGLRSDEGQGKWAMKKYTQRYKFECELNIPWKSKYQTKAKNTNLSLLKPYRELQKSQWNVHVPCGNSSNFAKKWAYSIFVWNFFLCRKIYFEAYLNKQCSWLQNNTSQLSFTWWRAELV